MQKHNSFTNKLKKQLLTINTFIESYFDKFNNIKFKSIKISLRNNNKVFLAIGISVTLALSYLTIPTFFNENLIQASIKNQIQKKYNIKIKFNESINYRIFPKPHFVSNNLSLIGKESEIGLVKDFKIYISNSKFFSFNNVEIKNLIFNKTDFEIYRDDFLFFYNLLKTEPNENKVVFKNSNLFFKDDKDEVLFINKIFNNTYYYDSQNLQNVLEAKNEIFNIPFKLIVKNDKFNKKTFINFGSNKIRLDIENVINYDNDVKDGELDLVFINKNISFSYEIKKNSFTFSSKEQKNNYDGVIDFKPFYLSANFNYEGLSSKNLFNNDSIIINIIKSEIFNNKNLNASINLIVKDVTNIVELNNLILKVGIDEGNFNFSDSSILWKDDLKIIINDGLLSFDGDEINLIGKFTFEFIDINNFYRYFQLQKNYRKKIEKIELDFVYNFNKKYIKFDNPKIDNKNDTKLEEFITSFNSGKNKILNKITFKNFVNDFFIAYSG